MICVESEHQNFWPVANMVRVGSSRLTRIPADEFAIYHRRTMWEIYDCMMRSMSCYQGLDFESFCHFCYCNTSLYPSRDHHDEIIGFWAEKTPSI